MIDLPPASRCPISARFCAASSDCPVALPPEGPERAALLVLRFLAAARDTGDACCWDAALDEAEAAFGQRLGPLVVGYAGALIRRLARADIDLAFLPPPCRRLSGGEALLLDTLRRDPSPPPAMAWARHCS